LDDTIVTRDVVWYGDLHHPVVRVVFAWVVLAQEEHVRSVSVKLAISSDDAWVDNTPCPDIRRKIKTARATMVGPDIETKRSLLPLCKLVSSNYITSFSI
jgi:hypothetical protein